MPGKEAHTPGNYACLNLNEFTTELRAANPPRCRFGCSLPLITPATARINRTGKRQPNQSNSSKLSKSGSPSLATGLVRPHYPNAAPKQYFERYPSSNELPFVPKGDWDDMPKAAISNSNSQKYGIDKFPDNQKRMWSGYLATVTFMDEQVGRILKALEELGLEKETAVFSPVTTDICSRTPLLAKGKPQGRSDPRASHHKDTGSKTRNELLHR